MSEPLKPRIDFDGPLQAEKIPSLKGARAFDTPGGRQLRASAAGDRGRGRGDGGSGGGVGPATQTQPVAADGQRRTGDLRRQRRGARRAVDG